MTGSPAGYLWDNCKRHGKSYRSYGEFASFRSSPDSEPIFVGAADLKGHVSTEWLKLKMSSQGQGRQRDTKLAEVFIKELQEAEAKGEWWDFMVMSLGENHTDGLTAGRFTPTACVASNDLNQTTKDWDRINRICRIYRKRGRHNQPVPLAESSQS